MKNSGLGYLKGIHLGNVLQVVTDRKLAVDDGTGEVDYYIADVVSQTDYYPFGMTMPGRNESADDYRYGFQGQEMDDEIAGDGNSYTAEFWQYDPRVARRWNLDPVVKEHESPYAAFANNPIWFVDPSGADTNAVAAIGGTLSLPSDATEIVTFSANQAIGADSGTPYDVQKGGVKSFKIGDVKYKATFNPNTQAFAGYQDSEGNVYNGAEVFDNSPFYYVSEEFSPDKPIKWKVYSGDTQKGQTDFEHDEIYTREVQVAIALGVGRFKKLLGISGQLSEGMTAALTFSGATKFSVQKSNVYYYKAARDWYGKYEANPFLEDNTGYVVCTGMSDEFQVRVGKAVTVYQLYFQGEPTGIYLPTDLIVDPTDSPTEHAPPTVVNSN